ncbi:SDR family NAD(P)-dependent oxidoreductase [Nocardia rhamnosiphila]
MNMTGKNVVVTGAATGIGRASAALLAAEGAALVLADINLAELEATAKTITDTGARCVARYCNVSDASSVESLIGYADTELGGIDAIVNSAGVQRSGPVTEFPESDWDLMLSVNPKSCFLLAKYAAPVLRRRGGGSIVNIASIAGIKGGPGQTAYSASKGAIVAFSRALAAELAPDIRVNSLCPGWVDTPFNQPAIDNMGGPEAQAALIERTVPLQRQGTVDEIARSVLFLAGDASSYMTGQSLIVDGGTV